MKKCPDLIRMIVKVQTNPNKNLNNKQKVWLFILMKRIKNMHNTVLTIPIVEINLFNSMNALRNQAKDKWII